MVHSKKGISRRKFLFETGSKIVTASSLAGLSSCSSGSKTILGSKPSMPLRTLGKTNLKVSILSFGGGSQFLKNQDGDWEPLMERAVQCGVNLFDTSSS